MASLYKTADGYAIQFGHAGRRRTLRAGRYKPAAVTLRSRIESLIDCAASRQQPTGELREWVDALTPKLRAKLAAWGLLDHLRAASADPIEHHIGDYIEHCLHVGHAHRFVGEKASILRAIVAHCNAHRLAEITAEGVERYLADLKSCRVPSGESSGLASDKGMSFRSVNKALKIARAFLKWAVKRGRLASNPLGVIPLLEEDLDPNRRRRRALTDEELARLLDVTDAYGRRAWYAAAAMAGLRRGDLKGIRWGDVDLDSATLTIRAVVGKSKRQDVIPLHPQLADELRRIRPTHVHPDALATMRVFASEVQPLTVRKDFLRAGLARKRYIVVATGEDVTLAQARKLRRAKQRVRTIIDTSDAEGRVLDLHAMRTTFGTRLARAGVAPQLAQRLMRHADYRTTVKHYTVLGLADTAQAVAMLPDIHADRAQLRATGTLDASPASDGALQSAASGAALGRESGRILSPSDRLARFGIRHECPPLQGENGDWKQYTRLGSNQQPSAPEADALSN